ncbi:hypothetical protein DESC_720403 [Desulfosarcina cetonica]|uniref:HEAT repeat domain-containing protein n=1 Tax=Desulfosarcina cetonica TaxID=90730 RepID=UPI0006D24455|nr:HEAT repeat domain-containing protein [Desulfosarcina cetonica]VTR69025.1 hypothetical protein DESC_720403 [Desulfosarcina cetonica]
MKNGRLIPFNRSHRLLDKVRDYLADMNTFFADIDNGVAIFLEILPHVDNSMLARMLPLLGYAGKEEVLWPLYDLTVNESTNEQIRTTAAIQLGLAALQSKDPSAINAALINMLDHSLPTIRMGCALALGWEGNYPAVQALIQRLDDPERDVQASVVTALVSVGGNYVFDLLKSRLLIGSIEEQRSILLNYWRFSEKFPNVEWVYSDVIMDLPADMRIDALEGMGMLPISFVILNRYRKLIADEDPFVRLKVLENLLAHKADEISSISDDLYPLLNDKDSRVRQAAVRLLSNL